MQTAFLNAKGLPSPSIVPGSLANPHKYRVGVIGPAGLLRLCRSSAIEASRRKDLRCAQGSRTEVLFPPGKDILKTGRAGGIRTRGLLVPNEALYQAEPRPDCRRTHWHGPGGWQWNCGMDSLPGGRPMRLGPPEKDIGWKSRAASFGRPVERHGISGYPRAHASKYFLSVGGTGSTRSVKKTDDTEVIPPEYGPISSDLDA